VTESRPTVTRNWVPWILLFLIFSFSIFGAVQQYLQPTRDEKAEAPSYRQEMMQLEMILSLERMAGSSMVSQANEGTWKRLATSIKPEGNLDSQGWKLKAVLLREAGESVDENILDRLSRASDGEAWRSIYGSKTLTKANAVELARQIDGSDIVAILARIHAREAAKDTDVRKELISVSKGVRALIASFAIICIIGFGTLAWIVFLIQTKNGVIKPAGIPPDMSKVATQDRFATLALALFAGFIVLSAAVPALYSRLVSGSGASVAVGVAMLIWVYVTFKITRTPFAEIGVESKNLGKNVGLGLLGFVMELPVAGMLAVLGSQVLRFLPTPSHPVSNALMENQSLLTVLTFFFMASVVAPIWEEIVFRGLLFPAFAGISKKLVISGIISSFLFAMIHPQGIPIWLALATVGGASCMLSHYSKSLVPSIVMHAMHNATLLGLTLLLFS